MMKFEYSMDYIIKDFLFILSDNNYFREEQVSLIKEKFPALYLELKGKSSVAQEEIIKTFVEKYTRENKDIIDSYVNELNVLWNKIGEQISNTLCDLMQTNWEKDCIGYVGIIPIYPRELGKRIFGLDHHDDLNDSIGVAIHELTHFIYFDKWASMFPNDKDWMFEAPHGVWHLSEIMAPVLNSDKKIVDIFPNVFKESVYMDMKFKKSNQSVHSYFENMYRESNSFEDFLIKARDMVTTDDEIF